MADSENWNVLLFEMGNLHKFENNKHTHTKKIFFFKFRKDFADVIRRLWRIYFNRSLITTYSVRLVVNTAVIGSKIEEWSAGQPASACMETAMTSQWVTSSSLTQESFHYISPPSESHKRRSIYSAWRSAVQRHQFNNGGLVFDKLRVIFLQPQGRGGVCS